jgi:hypothetical protein
MAPESGARGQRVPVHGLARLAGDEDDRWEEAAPATLEGKLGGHVSLEILRGESAEGLDQRTGELRAGLA